MLTSSRWLASWQGDLRIEDCRNWRTFQKVEKVNRVHVVWLLYEVFESIQFEWKHLNDIMKKHEVPLQILILTNPEKDPTGEFLERNFLGNRGFLFPDVSTSSRQVHFITIPSHCLSSVIDMAKGYQHPFMDHLPNQSSKDTLSLTQLVHRALSGSTEVLSIFQYTKDSSHHLQDCMNFVQEGSHHEECTLHAFYCLGCINLLAFRKGGWC